MVSLNEFINKAELIKSQNINISLLYEVEKMLTLDEINAIKNSESGIYTDNTKLIELSYLNGIPKERLFLRLINNTKENVDLVFDMCMVVLENKEDIVFTDNIAKNHIKKGYLAPVAISLKSKLTYENEITKENLINVYRWIRLSENLTARSIFIDCDDNSNLSRLIKENFSLIKKIRSDMPCLFSSFSLNGLIGYIEDLEVLDTLKIISSLNDTSFYARFFIK